MLEQSLSDWELVLMAFEWKNNPGWAKAKIKVYSRTTEHKNYLVLLSVTRWPTKPEIARQWTVCYTVFYEGYIRKWAVLEKTS